MSANRTPLELLAPARDAECGIAAINHGADAVYIGAPKFGARAAAGNPLKDIAELISYAHKYWARVYITLNTILYDNELEEARALIHELYDAGADALIIQDMGLLELDLPPIPLFASTQTHNYDIEKIRFLEQVGFQRVILARELSIDQVRDIRAATSLDLEFFVHGALCVSFSGQCYFSQAAMGRSANRGECAQMCRLSYTLTDSRGNVLANNQHVLSLRDLNLSEFLPELVSAGVTSFKIEGRLKDAAYVRNITSFYRRILDASIEGEPNLRRASSGTTSLFFQPDPERTFNRGYTDYFLHGRRPDIVSLHTPKSLGKAIGEVTAVSADSFTLDTTEVLRSGDGICFFDDQDQLTGTNINRVDGNHIVPNSLAGIAQGTMMYRNHDHAFLQFLKSDRSVRKIGVEVQFSETADGFQLRLIDEDGNEAAHRIAHVKDAAENPAAARATFEAQLTKLGGTAYGPTGFTSELTNIWFIPVKVLNQLRRDAVAALDAVRQNAFPRRTASIIPNDIPFPKTSLDFSANVVNAMADSFYRRHGVKHIEQGFELQDDLSGKVLMTTRHCLKYQFDLCRGKGSQDEELFLNDGTTKYKLEFDCGNCVMKVVGP
jgi:collagenase-like PrtC family protease